VKLVCCCAESSQGIIGVTLRSVIVTPLRIGIGVALTNTQEAEEVGRMITCHPNYRALINIP
jgi:hypothetical protein